MSSWIVIYYAACRKEARQIQRENDPKLEQLVEELAEIAAEAEREAINEQELAG